MTPVEVAWLRLQLLLGERREAEQSAGRALESIVFHAERTEAAAHGR